ncbi:hypothetical protein L6164_002021 [Bauhinia variegata]|uniref:Uncharacterized protein n=1 Tax=Bauhinia variegata TaxID=167791 RepID=A0ACB9PX27_BAUVA|nr:hypothetical protein L6164_002021 [Bauhinia variegata]
MVSISYNTKEIRKVLAIFVIEDEMTFSVVEKRGFRHFVNRLEPRITTLLKKKIVNTLWHLYNFYAQESHEVSQTSDDSASHEESVITKEGLADMGWIQEVFDESPVNDAIINEIGRAMTSVTNQAIQEGNRMSTD